MLMSRNSSCLKSEDLDQDRPPQHLTRVSPILVKTMVDYLNPDTHRIKVDHVHLRLNSSLIPKCRRPPPGRLRHYRKQRARDRYLILRSAPICPTLLLIQMYQCKARSRGKRMSPSPPSRVGKLLVNAEQSSKRIVRLFQLTFVCNEADE
jgi:hypothetical protein